LNSLASAAAAKVIDNSRGPRDILWDLDGTLTDPKVGILTSIRYALEGRGHLAPPMEELLWCIGPPLHDSFSTLVPSADLQEINQLIAKYRERFSVVGLFENELIPGIPEAFKSLSEHRHFLATSKPHVFAKRILIHFKLDHHFTAIHGSELDGQRSDKSDLIRHVLVTENVDPMNAVMIGDRKHDVIGARKASVEALGVLWGFGSRSELETAGASQIFETPTDLVSKLLTV
jgi:phosphoglycolate phosphatase